ncbi:brassinosteroid-responsive RING protein 1-like [Magnolia sinica]|uniref:brassinosteroid-responsive RING protein 1-like n=1 Tax=Magnolia sinica TaxID=86752 RepID=UPI002657E30B|nr:brassinosteroid-responsive RING protein 1-like [Magnolia sinica]
MGFPLCYSGIFFPKLLIPAFSLLGFIRKLICCIFRYLGLSEFIELDVTWPTNPTHQHRHRSFSAMLIREILPVVLYEDLRGDSMSDSCAVCLYEFEGREEIRRLTNCRHIFHRTCLDRWMDLDQKTCPLCRTSFVPKEMQEAFDEVVWVADIHGEYTYPYPYPYPSMLESDSLAL